MPEVRFRVAMSPAGKARPRVLRSGRTYTPKKTKDAEARVRAAASHVMGRRKPTESLCTLSVVCGVEWPKSAHRKRVPRPGGEPCGFGRGADGDNVLKLVSDAMNKAVYKDDTQVYWWTCRAARVEQGKQGFVEVVVTWQT